MPFLFQYLIKFSLSLAVLYGFYYLVLRPLTFYQWNRFYLLSYSLLSFIIPLINITDWLTAKKIDDSYLVNSIPAVDKFTSHSFHTGLNIKSMLLALLSWDLAGLLFITGALIMLARIIHQYLSLRSIKNKAVLLKTGDFEFYDVNGPISPFSFANAIFINSRLHTEEEFRRILEHEFVHVKQKHTIDIIVAELVCVFNWFNPFAWLIRKAIRQNLEFIADKNVLEGGIDARQYQYLLLKVMGMPQYAIANYFSFSSLKKRIVMMNKMKTAKVHLVKFLFILPLLLVMLLAFRDKVHSKQNSQIPGYIANGNDTLPVPPPPPPPVPPVKVTNVPPPPPVPPVKAKQVAPPPVVPPPPPPPMPPVRVTSVDVLVNGVAGDKSASTNIQRVNVTPVKTVAVDTIYPGVQIRTKNLTGGGEPLYIIDGEVQPDGSGLQFIDPKDIKEINVLKDRSGIATYGDRAKNGVVLVYTRDRISADDSTRSAVSRKELQPKVDSVTLTASKVLITNIGETKALIIINGKESSKEKLSGLEPNNIKSISVLKDQSAKAMYGEKGKEGVIIITTKD